MEEEKETIKDIIQDAGLWITEIFERETKEVKQVVQDAQN